MLSGLQHFQILSVGDKGCTVAVVLVVVMHVSWGGMQELSWQEFSWQPSLLLQMPVGHRDTPALMSVLGQVGLSLGKDWTWGDSQSPLPVAAREGFANMWSLKESLCLPNLHCHVVPPLEGTQGSGRWGNRRNWNHWALVSMDLLCFA